MKKEKRPSALSEGEESSLERFVRGEMECDPDVVPVPDAAPRQAKNAPDAQEKSDAVKRAAAGGSIAPSHAAARALRGGALHGALYYAGAEQPPELRDGRYQESDETVLAKMNSKEIFPQG